MKPTTIVDQDSHCHLFYMHEINSNTLLFAKINVREGSIFEMLFFIFDTIHILLMSDI